MLTTLRHPGDLGHIQTFVRLVGHLVVRLVIEDGGIQLGRGLRSTSTWSVGRDR